MIKKIYKNLAFLVAATGNSLLLLPIFSLLKNRYPCYAIENADICIEGFPRSGNSFFVTTFQQWNPGAIIAHHSHLASNAKYATRKNTPTVILIRAPADAIASAIAWDGKEGRIMPGVGLISYLSFYQSLKKFRQKILFLDFHEAVNHPDKCVEKINQRFCVNFKSNEFTIEEDDRLRNVLKHQDVNEKRTEMNSSLPNRKKGALKLAIVPKIKSHSLFNRAQALFEEHISIASAPSQLRIY